MLLGVCRDRNTIDKLIKYWKGIALSEGNYELVALLFIKQVVHTSDTSHEKSRIPFRGHANINR